MNITCITSENELQEIQNVLNSFPEPNPLNPYICTKHYICIGIDSWRTNGIGVILIRLTSQGEDEYCNITLQETQAENVYSWKSHYFSDLPTYLKSLQSALSQNDNTKFLDDHTLLPKNIPTTKIFKALMRKYDNLEIKLSEIPKQIEFEQNHINDKIERIHKGLKDASVEDIDFYTENFKEWEYPNKIKRILSLENTSDFSLFYIYWMIAEGRSSEKKINEICINIEDRIKKKDYKTSGKQVHVADLFFSSLSKDQALHKILSDDIKDITPEFMYSCG